MAFTPETLLPELQSMAAPQSLVVALSGGLDSTVLLHALVTLRESGQLLTPLRAIHVNHRLQAAADRWQEHCASVCEQWQVPLHAQAVSPDDEAGGSLEARARAARYRVFEQQLAAGEFLLLAHHHDDQFETQLLRLMRGAGTRGSAGMPRQRPLGQGTLWRPLLDVERRDLQHYAQAQALTWVEDDSNADTAFDRNYCRHILMPLIAERWPAYRQSWAKSAALAAESQGLLEELASADLAALRTTHAERLSLSGLRALSQARQRNVLRHWFGELGLAEPGWNHLHQIVQELMPAAPDAEAVVVLGQAQLACFQDWLCLVPTLPTIDTQARYRWCPAENGELILENNGRLLAEPVIGAGLSRASCATLDIGYRQGGERCAFAGRRTRPLKKVLQEAGVEPWLRARLPLIFRSDELVCVPALGTSAAVSADVGEPGWLVRWEAS